MGTFLILFAVTLFSLGNYELAYGFPWRPRPTRFEPENSRDRMERWLALVVAVLIVAITYLALTGYAAQ